jgi:hypothetical protein
MTENLIFFVNFATRKNTRGAKIKYFYFFLGSPGVLAVHSFLDLDAQTLQ